MENKDVTVKIEYWYLNEIRRSIISDRSAY